MDHIFQDPDTHLVKNVCERFVGSKISLNYQIEFKDGRTHLHPFNNCNIVGDCLEDILYPYLKERISTFEKGPKQASPDFINRNEYEWELKAFKASPSFDLSNFLSYIHQLSTSGGVSRKIFKTQYIIFKYDIEDGKIMIDNVYIKNVWDLVGYDKTYPVSLQCKKGSWYSIRPCSFMEMKSHGCKNKTHALFVKKMCEAIRKCPNKVHNKNGMIMNIRRQYDACLKQISLKSKKIIKGSKGVSKIPKSATKRHISRRVQNQRVQSQMIHKPRTFRMQLRRR